MKRVIKLPDAEAIEEFVNCSSTSFFRKEQRI